MSIFRVKHNKNYTVVNNFICTDKHVSWSAKGIWLYAFSRPNDWCFYLIDLINQTDAGKDAISKALKNLQDCGYLRRERIRNSDGTLGKSEWTFFETPIEENPEKNQLKFESPQPDYPALDKPTLDNPPLLSTDSLPSTEAKQITKNIIISKDDDDMKKRETSDIVYTKTNGQKIEMPESELYRYFLKKKYSTEILKQAIQNAREYKGPINNILKYIEGICKTLEEQNQRDSKRTDNQTTHNSKAEKSRKEGLLFKKYGMDWEKHKNEDI